VFAARGASIGFSVIRQFVPTSAPQLRFNCLNKPISAHPRLYCAQVRPYLLTGICEGSRAPTVLPVRGNDARLALRGPRTSGKAPVQATPGLSHQGRFLTGGAFTGSGAAALAGPIGAEAPRDAFCHRETPRHMALILPYLGCHCEV